VEKKLRSVRGGAGGLGDGATELVAGEGGSGGKGHYLDPKTGERRPRGAARLKQGMLDRLAAQLEAQGLELEKNPTEYLETRRILYIKGLEEVLQKAEAAGMLTLARACLADLVRLTTLHKLKIEATIMPAGLRRAPSLARMSDEDLQELESADDQKLIETTATVIAGPPAGEKPDGV
jgi:hypothetical protein